MLLKIVCGSTARYPEKYYFLQRCYHKGVKIVRDLIDCTGNILIPEKKSKKLEIFK